MHKIKILFVEDDPKWKEIVSDMLEQEPDLILIGSAETKEDAVRLVQMLDIDVVLMDAMLNGTGQNSVAATLEINAKKPSKVIMVTFSNQQKYILEAFESGVINYMVNVHADEIPAAVRAAYHDQSPIHFVAASVLRQELVHMKRTALRNSLTPTETSILQFLYQEFTQAEMMEHLHITESTVKKHVNKVIKKLGVRTSKEAVRIASAKGIL